MGRIGGLWGIPEDDEEILLAQRSAPAARASVGQGALSRGSAIEAYPKIALDPRRGPGHDLESTVSYITPLFGGANQWLAGGLDLVAMPGRALQRAMGMRVPYDAWRQSADYFGLTAPADQKRSEYDRILEKTGEYSASALPFGVVGGLYGAAGAVPTSTVGKAVLGPYLENLGRGVALDQALVPAMVASGELVRAGMEEFAPGAPEWLKSSAEMVGEVALPVAAVKAAELAGPLARRIAPDAFAKGPLKPNPETADAFLDEDVVGPLSMTVNATVAPNQDLPHLPDEGIDVHHGSRVEFEPEPGFPFGRFREDKIGTGEGAAVRGRGLAYTAEELKVAEDYHFPGSVESSVDFNKAGIEGLHRFASLDDWSHLIPNQFEPYSVREIAKSWINDEIQRARVNEREPSAKEVSRLLREQAARIRGDSRPEAWPEADKIHAAAVAIEQGVFSIKNDDTVRIYDAIQHTLNRTKSTDLSKLRSDLEAGRKLYAERLAELKKLPEGKYSKAEILHKHDAIRSTELDLWAHENAIKAVDAGVVELSREGGHVYSARIHGKPEEFLDHDVPLSQQPEGIKQKLRDGGIWHEISQDPRAIYYWRHRNEPEGVYKPYDSFETKAGEAEYAQQRAAAVEEDWGEVEVGSLLAHLRNQRARMPAATDVAGRKLSHSDVTWNSATQRYELVHDPRSPEASRFIEYDKPELYGMGWDRDPELRAKIRSGEIPEEAYAQKRLYGAGIKGYRFKDQLSRGRERVLDSRYVDGNGFNNEALINDFKGRDYVLARSIAVSVRADEMRSPNPARSREETIRKALQALGHSETDDIRSPKTFDTDEWMKRAGAIYDKITKPPTRNYVVIDEGDITITKRSGEWAPGMSPQERYTMPGLAKLKERFESSDPKVAKAAADEIRALAKESLDYLLSGTRARTGHIDITGMYGKAEPSIQTQIDYHPDDEKAVLAAIDTFGRQWRQGAVDRRVEVPIGTRYGKSDDGSRVVPVFKIRPGREMNANELRTIAEEAGLPGFSVHTRNGMLEVYYRGDADDEAAIEAWKSSVTRAAELAGAKDGGIEEGVDRLWVHGNEPGAIPYGSFGDVPHARQAGTPGIRRLAERLAGRSVRPPPAKHGRVSPEAEARGQAIAREYGEMSDNAIDGPNARPIVKAAYDELADEIIEQYDELPVVVEKRRAETGEPYPSSSSMRDDIRKSRHLYIYGTEATNFGPPGVTYHDHPLLRDSGRKDVNGEPLLINDLFRAIHDFYGHNLSDAQFGPAGEDLAWLNHMLMTRRPGARWAMTSELRGQNSYVNFGPNAAHNRANPQETIFSPQKTDLLPIERAFTGDDKLDNELRNWARVKEKGFATPEGADPDSLRLAAQIRADMRANGGSNETAGAYVRDLLGGASEWYALADADKVLGELTRKQPAFEAAFGGGLRGKVGVRSLRRLVESTGRGDGFLAAVEADGTIYGGSRTAQKLLWEGLRNPELLRRLSDEPTAENVARVERLLGTGKAENMVDRNVSRVLQILRNKRAIGKGVIDDPEVPKMQGGE